MFFREATMTEIQTRMQTYTLGFDNPLSLPDDCEVYAAGQVVKHIELSGYYKGKIEIDYVKLDRVEYYDEIQKKWIQFTPIDRLRQKIKDMLIEKELNETP
jgi:hypothetical protein